MNDSQENEMDQEKYDQLLKRYANKIANILNFFMKKTRPEDYDGPEPLIATRKTGEVIIEDWTIEALEGKS